MAQCKSCGKQIPDGTAYCEDCDNRRKADESYLDSLLHSVVSDSSNEKDTKPTPLSKREKREKKEAKSSNISTEKPNRNEAFLDEIDKKDFDDLEIGEQDPFELDLSDFELEDSFDEMDDIFQKDLLLSDEEKAEDLKSLSFEPEALDSDMDHLFSDSFRDDLDVSEDPILEEDDLEEAALEEDALEESFPAIEETALEENNPMINDSSNDRDDLLDLISNIEGEVAKDSSDENFTNEDSAPEEKEFSIYDVPYDAFHTEEPQKSLKTTDNSSYDDEFDKEATLFGEELAKEVFEGPIDSTEQDAFSQEEPFDPMAFFNSEDNATDENPMDLFGNSTEDATNGPGTSDELMDFWNMMENGSDAQEEEELPAQESQKDSAFFATPVETVEDTSTDPDKENSPKKKKKKGLFARIFGNVKEDLSEEELENRKKLALEKFEEDETKAADDVAKKKQKKEEQAQKKAEAAAQKKADKEQAERKKADEKLVKAEQKRLEKDKKEQAKRALIAEIEENEGKINKFGASIIIFMFAGVLLFITVGTGYYNYQLSIEKAQFDFDLQRYDDAYNDVYGLEIKEEDMQLYDQIMTVQYVNVQLLSYMRYHSLNMDAQALDSLLKGLRRYEKFIEHATELGVAEDLNYLKKQIVQQLEDNFELSETTAYHMIGMESQQEYSQKIFELVGNDS